MKNKVNLLLGMSLLSSSVFASKLNCESYYQDDGQRVQLLLDLSQQGPTISAKLEIPFSPASVISGMTPIKGETAKLIGETSQDRILISGLSKIKVSSNLTYTRLFEVNISESEFKKSGKFIIHVTSGNPSLLADGGTEGTLMQFTCQKK